VPPATSRVDSTSATPAKSGHGAGKSAPSHATSSVTQTLRVSTRPCPPPVDSCPAEHGEDRDGQDVGERVADIVPARVAQVAEVAQEGRGRSSVHAKPLI
jgi:hypothetical protein